ncbi:hypothetical protein [Aliikangiella coralliicola]|uniref:Uncharacterized protein n=1 Tax=Aliikangiella coralliicola TaxID=2592383 RepID=A0A545U4V3_9GAMM|nr:hypothetical protein [Aliikangiella coralliicola]TQV84474.1 hypothetical protein FLL46_22940 [Aliikangiella coralliicola]
MIEGKFDVVFRGQIVKSFELDDVKNNLVKLFKSSPQAVDRLFSGNEVVIRKGIDYGDAMKYQSALRNAGALALIKEVENDESSASEKPQAAPAKAPQSAGPTTAFQSNDSSSGSNSSNTEVTQTAEASAQEGAQSDGLTVAAVGAQILPDKVYEKREVDTSALSLAKAGERILPKKPPEEHPQPSTDHLSLDDK